MSGSHRPQPTGIGRSLFLRVGKLFRTANAYACSSVSYTSLFGCRNATKRNCASQVSLLDAPPKRAAGIEPTPSVRATDARPLSLHPHRSSIRKFSATEFKGDCLDHEHSSAEAPREQPIQGENPGTEAATRPATGWCHGAVVVLPMRVKALASYSGSRLTVQHFEVYARNKR
jgi:hypothetical protein